MAPFLFLPHFCLRSQPIWVWEAPPVVSAFPPSSSLCTPLPYSVIVPDAARNASWQTLSAVISTNWCVCVCGVCVSIQLCVVVCVCVCLLSEFVMKVSCSFALGSPSGWRLFGFSGCPRVPLTQAHIQLHTHTHTQLHTPDQLCIKSIK